MDELYLDKLTELQGKWVVAAMERVLAEKQSSIANEHLLITKAVEMEAYAAYLRAADFAQSHLMQEAK